MNIKDLHTESDPLLLKCKNAIEELLYELESKKQENNALQDKL